MAAFDLPDNPAFGDEYTSGGVIYKWNGYGWAVVIEDPGPTNEVSIGATDPGTTDTELWYDPDTGALKANVSGAWVDVSTGGGASVTVGTAPPGSPTAGALWFDTNVGQLFVYYDDGTSQQWVVAVNIGVGGTSANFTTGDAKLTLKTVADPGWIMMNDGTIGDATSSATTRANADCLNLYSLIWTNIPDAWAPVTGGRGASAAADWGAHKPIKLTRQLGRSLAVGGAGAGLTSRALGSYLGQETHAQTAAELAAHNHAARTTTYSYVYTWAGATITYDGSMMYSDTFALSNTMQTLNWVTVDAIGSGSPANVMQPTSFWNVMLKL